MAIVNKVAQSGLITLKLEEYLPKEEIVEFDLKDFLFKELILREKDFRAALKEFNWDTLEGKIVALHCSNDAIIPLWAFMLVTVYAQPKAKDIVHGSPETVQRQLLKERLAKIDVDEFKEQRVVVKGCGDEEVPPFAYVEITRMLRPVVRSLMFGEPCSTVPLYKRKIQRS